MRIDEFEFRNKQGEEIEPTKDQLVIYIKSLHKEIKTLNQVLELACDRLKNLYCSDYCGHLCDDWAMSEEDIKNECKIYYKYWNKECILEQAKEMLK